MATAKKEADVAPVRLFFQARPADLRGLKAFRADYPEARLRLLYRGDEALEVDGIRCVPCETFLRLLVPGEPLP